MRRFMILGHKAPLTADFSLNDLPGGAGRIDVLCRALGSSLFVSHGIRKDVETILLLQNQLHIRVLGDRVKRLNPDERSTAALLRMAIEAAADEEVESTPGILVSRRTLPEALDRLYQLEADPIQLHEAGEPLDSFQMPSNPVFILSDHMDFDPEETETLSNLPRLSLGEQALHTSQCITILHYLLDQRDGDVETELVHCHSVWSEAKAQMIKSLLEDFEIPVNLLRQISPSVHPIPVNGLAEVRILVRPRDLPKAQQIIADYFEAPVVE